MKCSQKWEIPPFCNATDQQQQVAMKICTFFCPLEICGKHVFNFLLINCLANVVCVNNMACSPKVCSQQDWNGQHQWDIWMHLCFYEMLTCSIIWNRASKLRYFRPSPNLSNLLIASSNLYDFTHSQSTTYTTKFQTHLLSLHFRIIVW